MSEVLDDVAFPAPRTVRLWRMTEYAVGISSYLQPGRVYTESENQSGVRPHRVRIDLPGGSGDYPVQGNPHSPAWIERVP